MKKLLFICVVLLGCCFSKAQTIQFRFQIDGVDIELNKEYKVGQQTFSLSSCKFYIAIQPKNPPPEAERRYYLLDISKPASLSIVLSNKLANLAAIQFDVGIDSLKSTSGVYGDALDPTNGMYWTWQSGYINIKLEGSSPVCPARKNKFQFHLGGYSYPYNSLRTVKLPVKKIKKQHTVVLDLRKFIESIDLSQDYQIMSPSKKSMRLAHLFSNCFYLNE